MDPVTAAVLAGIASQLAAELVAWARQRAAARRQERSLLALTSVLPQGGQMEVRGADGSVIRVTLPSESSRRVVGRTGG